MTNTYQTIGGLQIHNTLYQFIADEVTDGLHINADDLFKALGEIHNQFYDKNIALLQIRDQMQHQIDDWHKNNDAKIDFVGYKKFLHQIGYLLDEPADFSIHPDVDDAIAKIAGPQLVVPVTNERFVLNAVNARFGSLYQALYISDVIAHEGETKLGSAYNPRRGEKVVEWSYDFLDSALPLADGSYHDLCAITSDIQDGIQTLVFIKKNGSTTNLQKARAYIGQTKNGGFLFKNNNLHIEIRVDNDSKESVITDVILESAITSIIDFEDSAATVSNHEKITAYRNFLELTLGTLCATFKKNGKTQTRVLADDTPYTDIAGKPQTLSGRSVILVRNVGLHMFNPLVKDSQNRPIPEGILDGMVTALIGIHEMQQKRNSPKGNMYIVKPKMHGPAEVSFSVALFDAIESALGLQSGCLKIGIMDEERRTSVNLKACIKTAKERVFFINTGFLDRTGDEIHTDMEAGVMVAKENMKHEQWITAYEKNNVKTGLDCGFYKKAQIGKGMWAQPDHMRMMLDTKIAHLNMGANCSWVPSPNAATLHATHYHKIDVFAVQESLKNDTVNKDNLLIIPTLNNLSELDKDTIENEIRNNAQSILGYVVRWIDQGVGCSKVPDAHDIALMEDRATLRISSQHVGNWLHHGICTTEQVQNAFKEMAIIVDRQNKDDPLYRPMAPNFDGFAFKAALALALEATEQKNGYTEDILTRYRAMALGINE